MNVGITGGRDYRVTNEDHEKLVRLLEKLGAEAIIVGDCPTGVDAWVWQWAQDCMPCYKEEAEWDRFGKAAGPVRNRSIVDQVGALIAFPGNDGTADCVKYALKQKVPVYDVKTGERIGNLNLFS